MNIKYYPRSSCRSSDCLLPKLFTFFFKGNYKWPYLEYLDSLRGRTRVGQSPIISVVAGAIPTSGQIAEALAFPDISHTLIVWLSKCSVERSLINEKKKKKEGVSTQIGCLFFPMQTLLRCRKSITLSEDTQYDWVISHIFMWSYIWLRHQLLFSFPLLCLTFLLPSFCILWDCSS